MNAWDWYQVNRDHVQFATIVIVTIFVAHITAKVTASTIRDHGWPWQRKSGSNGRRDLDWSVVWFLISLVLTLLVRVWVRSPGHPAAEQAMDAGTIALILMAARAAVMLRTMSAERNGDTHGPERVSGKTGTE